VIFLRFPNRTPYRRQCSILPRPDQLFIPNDRVTRCSLEVVANKPRNKSSSPGIGLDCVVMASDAASFRGTVKMEAGISPKHWKRPPIPHDVRTNNITI
jgi:hypothetical protein